MVPGWPRAFPSATPLPSPAAFLVHFVGHASGVRTATGGLEMPIWLVGAMLLSAVVRSTAANGLRPFAQHHGFAQEHGRYNPATYVYLDGSLGHDVPNCGTGTGAAACKTAAATKLVVRALVGSMSSRTCGPVIVSIAAGTYDAASLDSPDPGAGAPPLPIVAGAGARHVALALGPADSGPDAAQCRVLWEAATPGSVVFSGGVAVDRWVPAAAGAWAAELPAGVTWPQTMRIDDEPATMARHPNAPPASDLDADYSGQFARVAASAYIDDTPPHTVVALTATTAAAVPAFPPGLNTNDTVGALVWPTWSWINIWAYGSVLVAGGGGAGDGAVSSVTLALDCGSCLVTNETHSPGLTNRAVGAGNRIILMNHSALVDAAGEFFANDTHALYLPRAGQDMSTASAWVSSGVGAVLALQGAGNITFAGIAFRDAEWLARGFQSGFNSEPSAYGSPDDGAVVLAGAVGVTFEQCSFRGVGGGAVVLSTASSGVAVLNSSFKDVGQSGVMLIGDGDTQPRSVTVANNSMDRIGTVLSSAGGVYITTGSDVTVLGNAISNCSRWGVALRSNGEAALSSNVLIQGNSISRTGLHTRDFGGISTIDSSSGHNTGVRIEGNCVRDTIGTDTVAGTGELLRPYYGWGVYLDNNSSNTQVLSNVVVNSSNAALFYHDGVNNTATNNIFAYGALFPASSRIMPVFLVQPHPGVTQSNNGFSTNVVYSPLPLNVTVLLVEDGRADPAPYLTPSLVQSNVYYSTSFPANMSLLPAFDSLSFSHWQALGYDANSTIADPQFADAAGGNWAMPQNGPAATRGFRQEGMLLQC